MARPKKTLKPTPKPMNKGVLPTSETVNNDNPTDVEITEAKEESDINAPDQVDFNSLIVSEYKEQVNSLLEEVKSLKKELKIATSQIKLEAEAVLSHTQRGMEKDETIFALERSLAISAEKSRFVDKMMDDLDLDFKLQGKINVLDIVKIISLLREFIKEHLYFSDSYEKEPYWHWPKAYQVSRWFNIGRGAVKFVSNAIGEINS